MTRADKQLYLKDLHSKRVCNHWFIKNFSLMFLSSGVVSTCVCLRVQPDKSERNEVDIFTRWVTRWWCFCSPIDSFRLSNALFSTLIHINTYTQNTVINTERTMLGRRDTCTTSTNTMLWRIQTLISWT